MVGGWGWGTGVQQPKNSVAVKRCMQRDGKKAADWWHLKQKRTADLWLSEVEKDCRLVAFWSRKGLQTCGFLKQKRTANLWLSEAEKDCKLVAFWSRKGLQTCGFLEWKRTADWLWFTKVERNCKLIAYWSILHYIFQYCISMQLLDRGSWRDLYVCLHGCAWHICEGILLFSVPVQEVRLSAAKALTALGMFARACEAVEK